MKSLGMMQRYALLGLLSVTMATSCKTGFRKEEGKVWYYEWTTLQGGFRNEVDSADYETFKVLSDDYAHDKNYAWHGPRMLTGADGSTFKTLGKAYAKDRSMVYYEGKLIVGADPATFKVRSKYYATDDSDCYWEGFALKVHDLKTFHLIGKDNDWTTSWGVDSRYAYYLDRGGLIEGHHMLLADAATFEPIVPKGDSDLSYDYARDKYQVYYCDTLVVGADPATFELINWRVARDKNHVYVDNYRLPDCADARTMKYLHGGLSRDSLHVFDRDSLLEGVDPETFNFWEYLGSKAEE